MDDRPRVLVEALAVAMEEAEQVAGSTGPQKKAYAVEALRAIADRSLSPDDASVVGALVPHMIELVIAASKGMLHINEQG